MFSQPSPRNDNDMITIRRTMYGKLAAYKPRILLLALVSTFSIGSSDLAIADNPTSEDIEIEVFHRASCGCCRNWIKYLQANGFTVNDTEVNDVDTEKFRLNVPQSAFSCHTAVVDGYVIEGHVSAREIFQLLKDKPDIIGLSVPGMPPGSPGMEGGDAQPYKVLAIEKDGTTTEYASYDPRETAP